MNPIFSRRALLGALALGSGLLLSACKTTEGPAAPVVSQNTTQTPTAVKHPRKVRIGLALGGGAARGFAHIGVIKVLEQNGITPDLVVGTSAGSVVGALYAAGNNGFTLQKMAMEMDEAGITDWNVALLSKSSGLLKGEALQSYINKSVGQLPIEKMKIPFGCVATDLQTGAPILFRRGNTGVAVRASSSVPSIFQPVQIGDRSYVDGGLVSPVPVSFAREMGADLVIGVNISSQPEGQSANNSLEVLLQTVTIMGKRLNYHELKGADVVIQPALGSMKSSDFTSRNQAIMAGEQAAIAAMPQLRQKLQQLRDQ